jgi:hypothetical protein
MRWVEITQYWYSVDMLWLAMMVYDGGTEYELLWGNEHMIEKNLQT